MDLALLRRLTGSVVATLPDHYTHREIGAELRAPRLAGASPRRRGSQARAGRRSFAALPDADLPAVAERILRARLPLSLDAAARFAIEDVLWAGQGATEIPKRTRREIARDLDLDVLTRQCRPVHGPPGRPVGPEQPARILRPAISRACAGKSTSMCFRNPGDWSAEDLFEQLGAFDAGDAPVRPVPRGAGLRRRHPRRAGPAGASPPSSTRACARRGRAARDRHRRRLPGIQRRPGRGGAAPTAEEPRLRLPGQARHPDQRRHQQRHRDPCRTPIRSSSTTGPSAADGLRWRDLQEWWKDTRQLASDEEAKRSLYQRLASALPGNSPPQRNLFDLYYKIHGTAVPALPALLPEVWLHWDPKTVRERGAAALLGHRMDFLLLLPHGQRVVLEVDGSHHYASPDGTRPAPARYAARRAPTASSSSAGTRCSASAPPN